MGGNAFVNLLKFITVDIWRNPADPTGSLKHYGDEHESPAPGTDSMENVIKSRNQLAVLLAGGAAVVALPALYVAYKGRKKGKKRKWTDEQLMMGTSLENASQSATGLLMTMMAAPAISTAVAYIIVQKLEDARIISRGLGNATQGLLTVAAAGPAIQGIGGIVRSAFTKGK